ncbi:MAG TPA: hypothetical protein VJ870_12460 [Amycolatopsis sp.]|nr:hypothetical protein [Amycolatopsis sp.]
MSETLGAAAATTISLLETAAGSRRAHGTMDWTRLPDVTRQRLA